MGKSNVLLGIIFIASFILCFFVETIGSAQTSIITIFFGMFWIGRILVDGISVIKKEISKK